VLNFSKVDTQEKAYILGLFAADGNMTKGKTQINIGLSGEDGEFIYTIRDILCSEHKISIRDRGVMVDPRNGQEYSRKTRHEIQIWDKDLYHQFMSHGIVPNKSWVLEPPKNIPAHLVHHWVRGYFDGDGTVTFNGVIADVCIYSASKIILEFINSLFRGVHTHKVNVKTNRNIFCIHYSYRKALHFLDYIYKDARVSLPRKQRKSEEVFSYYRHKPIITQTEWSKEEVQKLSDLYVKTPNDEIVAYFEGRSKGSIVAKAKKLGFYKDYSWRNSNGTKNSKWSEDDIKRLERSYPRFTREELQSLFPNRTLKALLTKAERLGLKRQRNIGRFNKLKGE
jgi:hypothetical protein